MILVKCDGFHRDVSAAFVVGQLSSRTIECIVEQASSGHIDCIVNVCCLARALDFSGEIHWLSSETRYTRLG
jgi:hypothetical protein